MWKRASTLLSYREKRQGERNGKKEKIAGWNLLDLDACHLSLLYFVVMRCGIKTKRRSMQVATWSRVLRVRAGSLVWYGEQYYYHLDWSLDT